ncbi:MAG: 1-deoxy-D-xylulose-5-phosphate reductoisomerase, partial [bacterium]
LTYPDKMAMPLERLDLFKIGSLTFEEPDYKSFPCLELAYEAGRQAGLYPVVLNAANEIANERFRKQEIGFDDITDYIKRAMDEFTNHGELSLESILAADTETRKRVRGYSK